MAASPANRLIDLYSDTKTRPSPAMRRAIAEADVGDEQKGEDPTTNALQERVADYLGMEAALFLPSGTMCNQIAMLVHCRPGDEIIGARGTHLFSSEGAGASVFAGAQTLWIESNRGIFTGDALTGALRTGDGRHNPISRVVVIEQTVNSGGGAVWPIARLADVSAVARAHGLVVHMDGARLCNASVALDVPASEITRYVDTTWVDLSKGLGCPIGGVLAGSRDFINEAWRWKHRLGGAMRQSGMMAAAGLYAMDHNVSRMALDHANAQRLAKAVSDIDGLTLPFGPVETNIVYFDCREAGIALTDLTDAMLARGVRMGVMYGRSIRAVTHLDISSRDIEVACEVLAECVEQLKRKKA